MSHTRSLEEPGESTSELSIHDIDSSDQARPASFYAAALSWEVTNSGNSCAMVEGNGIKIGFGKIEGFPSVKRPDKADVGHLHLGLKVDDLDEEAVRLCANRDNQPDYQSEAGHWRELLNPDGQPLCVSPLPATTL